MGLKEKILGRNNSVDVSEDVEGSGDYAEVGGQEEKSGLVQRIKKMGASGAKKVREKAEDPQTRQAAVEALRQIAESQGESRKGEPNDITGGRGGSTEEIMGRVTRTAEASPPVDATLQPTSRLGNVSDLARGRGMDEGSRSGDGMGGLGGMGTLKIGESSGDGMTPDEMATNYGGISGGMMGGRRRREREREPEREERRENEDGDWLSNNPARLDERGEVQRRLRGVGANPMDINSKQEAQFGWSLLHAWENQEDRPENRQDSALIAAETEMVAEKLGEYGVETDDWPDIEGAPAWYDGGDRQ